MSTQLQLLLDYWSPGLSLMKTTVLNKVKVYNISNPRFSSSVVPLLFYQKHHINHILFHCLRPLFFSCILPDMIVPSVFPWHTQTVLFSSILTNYIFSLFLFSFPAIKFECVSISSEMDISGACCTGVLWTEVQSVICEGHFKLSWLGEE